MRKRKSQHSGGIPPSIASLEMIARARRAGLAQAMEDMLSEPHRRAGLRRHRRYRRGGGARKNWLDC
jgi:hypothetical protein